MAASNNYYNSTNSTLEKRFHISSQKVGIISLGYEFSSILIMPFITYIFSQKHRPRWIGFGGFSIAAYVLSLVLLHGIYGPGEDAKALTFEYNDALKNGSSTNDIILMHNQKNLCRLNCKYIKNMFDLKISF